LLSEGFEDLLAICWRAHLEDVCRDFVALALLDFQAAGFDEVILSGISDEWRLFLEGSAHSRPKDDVSFLYCTIYRDGDTHWLMGICDAMRGDQLSPSYSFDLDLTSSPHFHKPKEARAEHLINNINIAGGASKVSHTSNMPHIVLLGTCK
jgi:hypothetical protein